MNSTSIMQAAKTVDDAAFADAWSAPDGRALFERIVADDRPAPTAAPRRHRARRRLVLGAAIAAAAGAIVAVTGIPGLQHNGAPAAYSITKKADGSIEVKYNLGELRDPATIRRLNAELAADGAHVRIYQWTKDCTVPFPPYAVVGRIERIGPWLTLNTPPNVPKHPTGAVATVDPRTGRATVVNFSDSSVWVIHPQRLPQGVTGFLAFNSGRPERWVMSEATSLPDSPCIHFPR